MTATPTDDEFRAAGFTPDAVLHPRSEFAFRLLCAFNGVDPRQAPKAWRYYPNAWTADAWERVARVHWTEALAAADADLAAGGMPFGGQLL